MSEKQMNNETEHVYFDRKNSLSFPVIISAIAIVLAAIFIVILWGLVQFAYAYYTERDSAMRAVQFSAGGLGPEMLHKSPVDLQKYAGRWYEIARMKNSFQADCACSTADYAVNPGNDNGIIVSVYNQCFATKDKDGHSRLISSVRGRAWSMNAPMNTALRVSFLPQFLQSPVLAAGDYWILYVDADYRYAVVGTPDRRYLWFLSREPTVSDAVYRDLVDVAVAKGYDAMSLSLLIRDECASILPG